MPSHSPSPSPPFPFSSPPPLAACLLLCLAAAACAPSPLIEETLQAQQMVIGMPKETLFGCAGVPMRQATAGEREFFTYRTERLSAEPAPVYGVGVYQGYGWRGYGDRYGYGYGMAVPLYPVPPVVDVRSDVCEATFTVYRGRVERLVFAGSPGQVSRLATCHALVENCIALARLQGPLLAPLPVPAPPAPLFRPDR